MGARGLKPMALYAQLPAPARGGVQELSLAWEDGLGDWHVHGTFWAAEDPDLEVMGQQVARAWVALARRSLDGP